MNDLDNLCENFEKDQLYEVERIVDKRIDQYGKIYYLVKWEGYPDEEMTWEPIENLETVIELIRNFELSLFQKQSHRDDLYFSNNNFQNDSENVINAILGGEIEDAEVIDFKSAFNNQTPNPNLSIKHETQNFLTINSHLENSIDTSNQCLDNFKSFKKLLVNNKQIITQSEQIKKRRRKRKRASTNSNLYNKNSSPNNFKSTNDIKTRSANHKNKSNFYPTSEDYLKGNILIDRPKSLSFAKFINGELHFWVTWDIRSDGTTPEDQLVPHHLIKKHYPYVLIDFYEERLRFGNIKISATSKNKDTQDLILEQLKSRNMSGNAPTLQNNQNVQNSTGINYSEGDYSINTPTNSNVINSANDILLEN